MFPIGSYDRLFYDVIDNRYSDYDVVTFGILIADPRQTEAREYILNYLQVFHNASGELFDFYLPGYSSVQYGDLESFGITIDRTEYYFGERLFLEFLQELNRNFGIQYTFNPMLILMSMKPGHLNTVEFIVIELDDNEMHSVRRSGEFFMALFDIFKTHTDLEHIASRMAQTYVKGNIIRSIINCIGSPWLKEIHSYAGDLKRYRIKSTS